MSVDAFIEAIIAEVERILPGTGKIRLMSVTSSIYPEEPFAVWSVLARGDRAVLREGEYFADYSEAYRAFRGW
jgi:hypothetical protein